MTTNQICLLVQRLVGSQEGTELLMIEKTPPRHRFEELGEPLVQLINQHSKILVSREFWSLREDLTYTDRQTIRAVERVTQTCMQLFSAVPVDLRNPRAIHFNQKHGVSATSDAKHTRDYALLRIAKYLPHHVMAQLPIGRVAADSGHSSNLAALGFPALSYGKTFRLMSSMTDLERTAKQKSAAAKKGAASKPSDTGSMIDRTYSFLRFIHGDEGKKMLTKVNNECTNPYCSDMLLFVSNVRDALTREVPASDCRTGGEGRGTRAAGHS
eukprot:80459-Amphidinium_carterae.1